MNYIRTLWVVALLSLSNGRAAASEALLIENVTVLSPELVQPLGNRHVLIRDGRIATISKQVITAPAGTRRLDGTGRFLTPGLMDSHVHVSDAIGLPPASADPAVEALEADFFGQQPRSYLYFGVTQLLDPSNHPERITAFKAQKHHPDIFRCGAAPVLDGYPALFIDKAVRSQLGYIFEPANAPQHPLPAGDNLAEHTPEAVVARIAASGALCVKVFLENGFGPRSDWPMMSIETLRRVRTAAHQRGLLLVAHANALDMQRIAVSGHVDVLMHGVWYWNEVQGTRGIPDAIGAHLQTIHKQKIGYQATLRVLPGVLDMLRPETLDDPMYSKVVPPGLLAWYRTEPAQWFRRQVYGNDVDAVALLARSRTANQQWATSDEGMRALRYLYELGHPLLLGSDTPSAPTYGNQPGYDTYREMQLMAQAGIPLPAIFAAATINNARQFKLDKDYGTIEQGKIANLLVLEANPLATVEAWNRIDKVILHGELIERETLAADQTVASSKSFSGNIPVPTSSPDPKADAGRR